jgi:hypothetical protein
VPTENVWSGVHWQCTLLLSELLVDVQRLHLLVPLRLTSVPMLTSASVIIAKLVLSANSLRLRDDLSTVWVQHTCLLWSCHWFGSWSRRRHLTPL